MFESYKITKICLILIIGFIFIWQVESYKSREAAKQKIGEKQERIDNKAEEAKLRELKEELLPKTPSITPDQMDKF